MGRKKQPPATRRAPDADDASKMVGKNSSEEDKARGIGDPSYLRSMWVILVCIVWVPLTGIPAILSLLLWPILGLSQCQRLTWRCSTVFFKLVLWSSGCPYTVEGLEQLDPDANYFFACNHESLWDVPLVFAAIPFWLISIAKKSLRLVPVFGWAVAAGGTVWIDRKNHSADMKSMEVAQESLRKRPRSVLIFPEGTRTPDGNLQPFKKGGFVLAIQAGMPVVPVCLCGTFDVVIKGGRRFWRKKQQVRPRPLKLVIGSPIRTDDMRYEDRDALTERVMAQIQAMKAEWKQSGDKCDNLRVEPFWHCFLPTPPCDDRGWWGRVSRGRGS